MFHEGRAALASSAVDDESLRGDREPSFLRLRERRWLDTALREENADIRSSVERVTHIIVSNSHNVCQRMPFYFC